MEKIVVRRDQPGGYRAGDAVLVKEKRPAHVVAIPPEVASDENGQVPVMYDDEDNCFVFVPADDLRQRF